jgi:hypothetical protein
LVHGRQFILEWFNRIDLNQNSQLSFDESKGFLPKINNLLGHENSITEDELMSYWRKVDLNNDNKVDFSEFKEAVLKYANEWKLKKGKLKEKASERVL